MKKTTFLKVFPYLLLPLLFYIAIEVYTIANVFYMSLHEWSVGITRFVGVQNFVRIFHDKYAIVAALHSIEWVAVSLIAAITVPFALALLLNLELKWGNLFQLAFIIPQGIAYTAAGLIWATVYSPDAGILNMILRGLGLGNLARPWLGDPDIALFCLIISKVWLRSGFYMMIYLTRLQSLPRSIIEAAEVDGANAWQRLRYVIVPLMKTAFVIVITLDIIESLRTFDVVYATTRGGPGMATEILGTRIYKEAFNFWEFGYSSAISTVLFLIAMAITVVYLYFVLKGEEYQY